MSFLSWACDNFDQSSSPALNFLLRCNITFYFQWAVLPRDSFSHSCATAFAVKSSSNDLWVFFLIGTKGGDLWSWWWSGSRNPSTFFTGKWGARLYQHIPNDYISTCLSSFCSCVKSLTTQAQTDVLIKTSQFIVRKRCKFSVECDILRIVHISSWLG